MPYRATAKVAHIIPDCGETRAILLLLQNRSASLDLGKSIDCRVLLEQCKLVGIDIDGKHHPLGAVRVGSLVPLLAVKVSWPIAIKGDVEGFEVGDVVGVEVVKVGVELSTGELGAWLLEARFSQGVVESTEIEVDALALADTVDIRWVVNQLLVGTD